MQCSRSVHLATTEVSPSTCSAGLRTTDLTSSSARVSFFSFLFLLARPYKRNKGREMLSTVLSRSFYQTPDDKHSHVDVRKMMEISCNGWHCIFSTVFFSFLLSPSWWSTHTYVRALSGMNVCVGGKECKCEKRFLLPFNVGFPNGSRWMYVELQRNTKFIFSYCTCTWWEVTAKLNEAFLSGLHVKGGDQGLLNYSGKGGGRTNLIQEVRSLLPPPPKQAMH